MSEQHTPEPWPEYIEVAVVMTPNPDGPDAAVLSFEDYRRARACVNACAGIPTENLERIAHVIGMRADILVEHLAQRDWLLAALQKIAASDPGEGGCYYTNRENIHTARSAISIAKAKP